jgi:predicted dehydrogenase
VVSVHYRGGLSRGTNFHWEINGTDGDLVITGDTGHLQVGEFSIAEAHGSDAKLSRLTVPERYVDPALKELRGSPAYTVGAAYAQIQRDLTEGGSEVPDFGHASRHQRLLDRIERAAEHT